MGSAPSVQSDQGGIGSFIRLVNALSLVRKLGVPQGISSRAFPLLPPQVRGDESFTLASRQDAVLDQFAVFTWLL